MTDHTASIHVFSKKVTTHRMTRWGTQERMMHLTLVSSCVLHRLGAELNTSYVDRRWARRASFVRHRRGGKKRRAASECQDAKRKKSTRLRAQRRGETHAHMRGAGLSFDRAQTCEQMTAHRNRRSQHTHTLQHGCLVSTNTHITSTKGR